MTSMILHELGTNAVKYGAFSNAEGVVSVEWEVSAERDRLRLQWREDRRPAGAAAAASRLWLNDDRTRDGRAWRRDTHRVRADGRRL